MAKMSTTRSAALGIAALLLVSAPAAAARASVKLPEARPRASAERKVASAVVLGTAWKGDNTPIPHALLRLRNVVTGRAEAMTIANAQGQFTFANVETGTYVVELVNEDGRVLALGQVFAVAAGETVATFVRLNSRRPWLGGFLSNAGAAAVTAASSLGLTALGSNGQPVSAATGSGR